MKTETVAKLCAVFIILLLVSWITPEEDTQTSKSDQSIMAGIQCKMIVEERLRSPSTADFPFFGEQSINLGNSVYLNRSYVDAQNGFGATVRTDFICKIKYLGGSTSDSSNWTVVNLIMD